MEQNAIFEAVKEKAQKWLDGNYDEKTKKAIQSMMDHDQNELIESFYQDLEFGTGGLRGIMGVGTNRMNIYTVGMATQGLCNYLLASFKDKKEIKVVVGHDSRNNSRLFAETTAQIFSANGIKVFLFESLRPTPELSFAIRHFGCQSGVVITASHNPKEYNGYKAYWEDGGQLIEPHDINVVNEARKISNIDQVKFNGSSNLIESLGNDFDEIYLGEILKLSLSPEIIKKHSDIKIVYTPIHGTGVKLVPEILRKYGFKNIITVAEQEVSDGNFPTVISPNPENAEALSMAIAKAKQTGADLVMATDPDADRVGIAVRTTGDDFVLLNGNQTGAVLVYYLVKKWSENGKLQGKEYIVKTIVTTELISDIAAKFKVELFDVLTGFKFIADIIKKNEGIKKFIGGGEESYGYLAAEFVRDKDAVMACALIAEAAAYAKDQGKTIYDLLMDIYLEFGCYYEDLVNVVKTGKSGAEEIQKMMKDYRENPPASIDGLKVIKMKDYQLKIEKDLLSGNQKSIDLPKSNVLQFFLEDGTKISARPSGTEPKAKFYFSLKAPLNNKADFPKVWNSLKERIGSFKTAMKL